MCAIEISARTATFARLTIRRYSSTKALRRRGTKKMRGVGGVSWSISHMDRYTHAHTHTNTHTHEISREIHELSDSQYSHCIHIHTHITFRFIPTYNRYVLESSIIILHHRYTQGGWMHQERSQTNRWWANTDFVVWCVAFGGTIVCGIVPGIVLSVSVSLLAHLYKDAKPAIVELGEVVDCNSKFKIQNSNICLRAHAYSLQSNQIRFCVQCLWANHVGVSCVGA